MSARPPEAPDVVRSTAAHQETLTPPPSAQPPRVVVLALPRPMLCAVFEPERFGRLRAKAVFALAERIGGGDGPAPVIDLEDPENATDLPAQLDRLAAAGVDRLVLYGAAERPIYAREIAARFPGGVEANAPDALLWRARTSTAPVVELGEGLYRIDEGTPPPPNAAALLWRTPGEVDSPRSGGENGTIPMAPLADDPEGRLGAGVGLSPPAALAGHASGTKLRDAWAAFWPHEVFRAAVLGLDPLLEAALARAPAPEALPVPLLAVTGMDGSGKSTHVEHLARALSAAGQRVAIVKLYRQGAFLQLADELGARTRRGGPISAFRLSRVVKLWDTLRVFDEVLPGAAALHDVLIGDRWTETHLAAAASQLGWDLRAHGALACAPAPEGCAWLLLPPEVALARIEARGVPRTADEHPAGLAGYAWAFDDLSRGGANLRLDARADEAENVGRIRGFFRVGRGDASATEAPRPTPPRPAPPAQPLGTRTAVVLGAAPGSPTLAASARPWLHRAGAVSLDFVLEGLAARVLLDLRETRPARASAPLWPGVLHRLFPDLSALAELDRLLSAEATIVGWRPPTAADFAFAPSPAGAARLTAAYGAALADLAAEQGWPRLPDAGAAGGGGSP